MQEKYSIFKSARAERKFREVYEQSLKLWAVPYESRLVNTTYGKTHVLVSGPENGEPMILLHGMTFNSTMWVQNISALSKRYRTFCIDTMGDYGRSVVKEPLKTRQDCNKWLSEVMDSLGLEQAIYVGHSMGGWLSLNLALTSPERVVKLVLLAPIASIIRLPIVFMLKVYPVMLRPTRERILRLWKWFLARGSRLHPWIEEMVVQGWMNCTPQLRVVPHVFKKHELSSLKPKTLFLVGDEEVVYNASRAIKRALRLLPGVKAEGIPKASHCFVAEQPELVNQKILRFLDKGE